MKIISRTGILLLALLTGSAAKAQLQYLGEEQPGKNADAYEKKLSAGGLVKQNGTWYFTTPNGNFYQTNGTEDGTKLIKSFPDKEAIFLAATDKFIYFGTDDDYGKALVQYNPATGLFSSSLYATEPYEKFSLNGTTVPGSKARADGIFVNAEHTSVFFRTFRHDKFRISSIDDNNPSRVNIVAEGYYPTAQNPDVTIAVGTVPAFIRDEVFYNGRIKNPKVGHYETSVSSAGRENGGNYSFKSDYRLEEKEIKLYDGFLRTPNALYALIQLTGKDKGTHQLLKFDSKNATTSKQSMTDKNESYAAEVVNGIIYISNKGNLWGFSEADEKFYVYADDKKLSWAQLQPDHKFLRAGNWLLGMNGAEAEIYHVDKDEQKTVLPFIAIDQPNRYDEGPVYAYAGKKYFYFMRDLNGKPTFNSFNPETSVYKTIDFPAFKKESFTEIRAIFPDGDHLLILTKYEGKKGKPVYKIFMYAEE